VERLAAQREVAADRVGHQAAVILLPGDLVAEVAHAERGVQDDAAVPRGLEQRIELPARPAHAADARRAQVGQDVAGRQLADQVLGDGQHAPVQVRVLRREQVADVHHQRQSRSPGGSCGRVDDLLARFGHERADQPELHAGDHAWIALEAAGDALGVDVVHAADVRVVLGAVRERAHVEVEQHPRPRAGEDVSGEDARVRDPHRASVEHRGHARADADLVGVAAAHPDARSRATAGDVRVQVDEPGHHVPAVAAHVDHLSAISVRDVVLDRGYAAVRDPDISSPVDALARVQHVTILQDELIAHDVLLSSAGRQTGAHLARDAFCRTDRQYETRYVA